MEKVVGRPKTIKNNIPKKFKSNYFLYRKGEINLTDLARKSGVSYNTMKKYVRIMSEVDDEYYTTFESCENELARYIEFLNGKKIYCPCDSNKSNIVKWLKKRTTANVKNTFDDYMNHKDLFEWCDVIITNPPFSAFKDTFFYFQSFRKDIFIVMPLQSIGNTWLNEIIIRGKLYVDRPCQQFIRPDGKKKELFAQWLTTQCPKKYTK